MPFYRILLVVLGIAATVLAGMTMDVGAWIALAAGMIVASQFVAENVNRRRSNRIAYLEGKIEELEAAQAKCEARLMDAYRWIQWAQQSMQLRADAPPQVPLPLILPSPA